MFGFKKNEKKVVKIKVRKLRRPRVKGVFSIAFIDRLSGARDVKKDLIRCDEKNISSNWIKKRQTAYSRYGAIMYKVAGRIMKKAYIQRENVNDELLRDMNELKEIQSGITKETPESVDEKRVQATLKKRKNSVESRISENLSLLKGIKISIEEAEHELNQILQEKKLTVEKKILNYIQGAGKLSEGAELIVENELSRLLYESLSDDFEYCISEEEMAKVKL